MFVVLLFRRMTFKSYEERKMAADRMVKESEQIEALFDRILRHQVSGLFWIWAI